MEFGAYAFDAEAEEISQPVLYVLASESLPMFGEGRDLVRTWFPQTEDHPVQDVNHSLQMEDPRSVAEAIAAFLGRHPMTDADLPR